MRYENLLKRYGLEKPFRIKDDKKKYAVLVRNPKSGRINKIKFGAVGYSDFRKHKDTKRRKSFRARHRCSNKNDKLTPGYWSCKWSW